MICKISREADWTPLDFYDLFPTDKEFLTVRELSKLLEIHEKTIRNWINNCRSDLAPVRVKGKKRELLYYKKEDIQRVYPAHFKILKEVLILADFLYSEYGEAVGGVAYNGDPLPTWKEFYHDESKRKQRNAWLRIAERFLLKSSPEWSEGKQITVFEFDINKLKESK